jgi:hypothetical protein
MFYRYASRGLRRSVEAVPKPQGFWGNSSPRGTLRGAEPPLEGVSQDFDPAAGDDYLLFNLLVGVLEQAQFEFSNKDTGSGTAITMTINADSKLSLTGIFNEYADPDKQPGFYRAAVPLQIMQHEGDSPHVPVPGKTPDELF